MPEQKGGDAEPQARNVKRPDAEFWERYDPHYATPHKFYFFTGAFDAEKGRAKLKMLERYVAMVKGWTAHPERLVDILSLTKDGTTLGWDYEHERPPETWWEKNRFFFLSPQVAITNKVTAAAVELISPKVHEVRAFASELRDQKQGNIFDRVSATMRLRKSRQAARLAPAPTSDTANHHERPDYGSCLSKIRENARNLGDTLKRLEEDVAQIDGRDTELGDGSETNVKDSWQTRASKFVEILEGTDIGKLVGELERALSEDQDENTNEMVLAACVESARTAIQPLLENANVLKAEAGATPESEHLDEIATGLVETLATLQEIDLRRVLTPAIRELESGYAKVQEAWPPEPVAHAPRAILGRAMMPFFTGEYETFLEQIIDMVPAERAGAVQDAQTALSAAAANLAAALAPLPDAAKTDADRPQLGALRDTILAVMRPALEKVIASLVQAKYIVSKGVGAKL